MSTLRPCALRHQVCSPSRSIYRQAWLRRLRRLGRLSRDVPSEKMEQFGRAVYLDVVKELDAACDELGKYVFRENWDWKTGHVSPNQTIARVPSNGISKAGRAVKGFSENKSNPILWKEYR